MHMLGHVRGIRGEIRRALWATSMPARARCDLVTLALAKRVALPAEWPVHLPSGVVYLSRETLREDTSILYEVLQREIYKAQYEGAAVIDVGAHRGYYGAYALCHGARAVFSYEPEAHNFASLTRAADLCRLPGQEWRIHQAAVSSVNGHAILHVTKESWTHSLLDWVAATGTQDVPVVAMADVLSLAGDAANGAPLIVKLDCEGAECPIILETPPAAWQQVTELFLDVHDWAACGRSALVPHLERAGLSYAETRVEYSDSAVLVFRQRTSSG